MTNKNCHSELNSESLKELISIDIFDTAIFRKVYEPTDIFKIIEQKVGNDFYNKRIEAERLARQKNEFYTIEDIYWFIPEFDMQVELDAELENCYCNSEMLSVYEPNDTVFISDMYLSSEFLCKMLEKCGYKNPRVYVSCEQKAYKSGGELFKKVQQITGCKIIVHFGDNYVADIEGAKIAGITTPVFEPALHKKKLNLPSVKNPYLKKYLAIVENDFEPLEKLALYHVPLIYEFTKWVLDNRKHGQKIFFLSRDMYMPYIIAKEIFDAKEVYYLHASRRSLSGLGLKSGNEQLKRKLSLILTEEEQEYFLNRDEEEAIKYLKQFVIKDDDIIADIGYSGTIQAIIDNTLGIKTQGLYMQTSSKIIDGIKTKMFLFRKVIHFCLMVEFVLGSPEDSVEYYKDCRPVFIKDNSERKEISKHITETIMEGLKYYQGVESSVYDIEQILIHQQYYPSEEIINLYNQEIYTNRSRSESIIGFNKNKIEEGYLRELYACSYCQPLFLKLLEHDRELSHLSRLLA